MKFGYVYIISTLAYKKSNIYKIGCTKNIEKRLIQFNATRMEKDKFFVVELWESNDYFKLESLLHEILLEYRQNNEFFKCNINVIKSAYTSVISKNYKQLVCFLSQSHNLQWDKNNKIFILKNKNLTEDDMLQHIKKWLVPYDNYNLLRFSHKSFWDELLYIAKYRNTNIVQTIDTA